jgi:putative chitinase
MKPLTIDTIRDVAPNFQGETGVRQSKIIDALGPVLENTLSEYDISTDLRVAHFLAQVCHESAGFRTTEEFAKGTAYEGRADLGNTQPGDGPRYKGRGLIQLTGRANYQEYGQALSLDLVGNPTLASDPVISLKIACEYWKRHDLNRFADLDDIKTITRRINGGLNGLEDRKAYLTRAKAALGVLAASNASSTPPVLRQGDTGAGVQQLQIKLKAAGYALNVDGSFGPGTLAAVKRFQAAHQLDPDGVVGPGTWAALA